MSWYDFGHKYPEFCGCLPDGKEPIDTGLYYHELMVIGGWYYHPRPGSGGRTFYNRVYLNPSREDKELYDLDERATAFINLAKSKFGQLEVKLPEYGWVYDCDSNHIEYRTTAEERAAETEKWESWYNDITIKVKKSYIVLYPENRNDGACIFDSYEDAFKFAQIKSKGLSKYLLEKYGVLIYRPHSDKPMAEFWKVVE